MTDGNQVVALPAERLTTARNMPIEKRYRDKTYKVPDRAGAAEQRSITQLIGEAEKARILADEKALLDELCAYRDFLCLATTDTDRLTGAPPVGGWRLGAEREVVVGPGVLVEDSAPDEVLNIPQRMRKLMDMWSFAALGRPQGPCHIRRSHFVYRLEGLFGRRVSW